MRSALTTEYFWNPECFAWPVPRPEQWLRASELSPDLRPATAREGDSRENSVALLDVGHALGDLDDRSGDVGSEDERVLFHEKVIVLNLRAVT